MDKDIAACQKYKQSNPDAQCDCEMCYREKKTREQLNNERQV